MRAPTPPPTIAPPGPAARRRPPVALAGAALLLLAGCAIPGLSKDTPASGPTTGTGSSGPPWSRLLQGSQSTTPTATGLSGPNALAFRTLPPVAAASPGTPPVASWLCEGHLRPGMMNGLTVTPGTRSAVVTWPNAGDPTVSEYRVAGESQRLVAGAQPAPVWKSVKPGVGCSQVSTTVTGLTSNTYYVFWLDAVTTAPTGRTKDTMIARSAAVLID
jgi:hypothetical protein